MEEDSHYSFNTDLASGSIDDDGDVLDEDFLQRLDAEDISELRKHFFEPKGREKEHRKTSKTSKEHITRGYPLTKAEFVKAIDSIIGSTAFSLCASQLFVTLELSQQGVVWWEDVLDHIIKRIQQKIDDNCAWRPIAPGVHLQDTPHCNRETIIKVVSIETASSFCYAVLSKYGRVGVYDGHFVLHDSYKLQLSSGVAEVDAHGEAKRRNKTTWLTDGVHLADAHALLVVSSDRAVNVLDASGLVHAPLCHVSGMRNVPQCLAYANSHGGNPSMLFIGDDKGDIMTMRFHQPKTSLFRKKHPDKLDKYYWKELECQGEWVTVSVDSNVHNDAVRQVAYFPDNETVVSCSQDPLTTLVIRHLTGRKAPYIFKLSRGVRCFHMERTLKLLATGSNDQVVRVWNPVVTKEAIVSFFGHKSAVIDVLILGHIKSVLSCSKDGVVKVWDLDDQCCLQSMSLNFPSFSLLGKRIEFGTRSIYPGPSSGKPLAAPASQDDGNPPLTPKSPSSVHTEDRRDLNSEVGVNVWLRPQLLVACCEHIALLTLNQSDLMQHGHSAYSLLPPPSREHHASVPSPWKQTDVTVSNTTSNRSPSNSPVTLSRASSPPRVTHGDRQRPFQSPEDTEDTADDADQRDVQTPSQVPEQQVKKAHLGREMREMKRYVQQCAPHLALRLWELEPVRFSRPLPITNRMREKGIDVSDPEKLVNSRLYRDSQSASMVGSGSLFSSTGSVSERSSRTARTASKFGTRLTPERCSTNHSKGEK